MLDREEIYAQIGGEGKLDYEIYINTKALLSCQKAFEKLCNGDELQFQTVHQVAELWMKLMAYTLLDAEAAMAKRETIKTLALLKRVTVIERLLDSQLELLETMSPKAYQEIRLELGNGSGQESPGFRLLLKIIPELWPAYETHYLKEAGLSLTDIYDTKFAHSEAYALAEALLDVDELFVRFRNSHFSLVHRTIGLNTKSLKGRPVEVLEAGMRQRFFPELWEVRSQMTDRWGATYGQVRDSLKGYH